MRRLALVLAGFACTKAAPPPAAPTNATAAAASIPCPAAADVAARLRVLWSVPAEQKLEATCAPGRFPAPGWAISAVVDTGDEAWDRAAVLAAGDGAVIAQGEEHAIAPWYRSEGGGGVSYEPRDFDGDGVDELISTGGASHGGSTTSWLAIERVAGGAIVDGLSLETHYDNGAAVEDPADAIDCDAEVTYVPEGTTTTVVAIGKVATQRTGALPEDCFVGRRVYRLVGATFIQGAD